MKQVLYFNNILLLYVPIEIKFISTITFFQLIIFIVIFILFLFSKNNNNLKYGKYNIKNKNCLNKS